MEPTSSTNPTLNNNNPTIITGTETENSTSSLDSTSSPQSEFSNEVTCIAAHSLPPSPVKRTPPPPLGNRLSSVNLSKEKPETPLTTDSSPPVETPLEKSQHSGFSEKTKEINKQKGKVDKQKGTTFKEKCLNINIWFCEKCEQLGFRSKLINYKDELQIYKNHQIMKKVIATPLSSPVKGVSGEGKPSFTDQVKSQFNAFFELAKKLNIDHGDPPISSKEDPKALMQVPSGLLAQTPKSATKGKKNQAKEAYQDIAAHTDVTKIFTPLGDMQATSTAFRLDEALNKQVRRKDTREIGAVNPTSGLSTESAREKAYITNNYVIKDVNGIAGKDIIRTGVINTKKKAEEFLAQLKARHTEIVTQTGGNLDYRMCILSHQLNSFEGESDMIEDQHGWLAWVNREMQKANIGEIAHINTPSNASYYYNKAAGDFIFPGEKRSREQNIDSLCYYSKWLVNNDKNPEKHRFSTLSASANKDDVQKVQSNIQEAVAAITYTKHLIKETSQRIKELEKELDNNSDSSNLERSLSSAAGGPEYPTLKKLDKCRSEVRGYNKTITKAKKDLEVNRNKMKLFLEKDYVSLKEIAETLKVELDKQSDDPQIKQDYQKAVLMHMLLGSQLGIKKLDRGQEGMIIQLLNSKLDATSQINCKSGLDRTGLWHAIKVSMDSNKDQDKLFEMVTEWDGLTTELNKELSKGIKGFESWLGKQDQLKQEKFNFIIKFRKDVLKNLITTGIPVTFNSTGIMGLKWSPESFLGRNALPMNFLPSHIQITQPILKIGDHAVSLTEKSPNTYTGFFKNKPFTYTVGDNIQFEDDDDSDNAAKLSFETLNETVQLTEKAFYGNLKATKYLQQLLTKTSHKRGS